MANNQFANRSDEMLTLETSAFKPFTVANLRHQLNHPVMIVSYLPMLCHWIPHPNFSCVACGYKLASNEKQSIYSDTKIKGPCPQQKAKPYFLYCLNQSVKYTTIIAVITMTF